MSIWKLSASAYEVAKSIGRIVYKPPQLDSTNEICELIARLSATRETAALPWLASWLFSSSKSIHLAASSAIAELIGLVRPIELIRLSELLGAYNNGYYSERWGSLKSKQAEAYLKDTNDIALGNLLSLHANGYVRQAAVQFLSGVETGEEIRFLLLRQNDWVDSISELAKAAVTSRLTADNLASFVRESELMIHLLQCKRRDLSTVVSKFVDLLIEPTHHELLIKSINSCDNQTARKLIGLILNRDGDHLADVVRLGVCAEDAVVRSQCLRRAISCLPSDECSAIAERMISDKFIPVRVEAYELKSASSPAESNSIWKRALFDTSRSLRETATFYLKKDGVDVASLYREHLLRFSNSLPAFSGLVATGDETDLALFSQFLTSPYASRRAEAIRGICRVGGKSDIASIGPSLLDESAKVVKAAYLQLSTSSKNIDPASLFGQIGHCRNLAGKQAILRLLLSMGRWPSMCFLIQAAADEDAQVAVYAKSLIDTSFAMNRVFSQPSSDQKCKIQTAIDASTSNLQKDAVADLRSYLSIYGFTV